MNVQSYFSKNIIDALKNNPPGEWMTDIPNGCIRLNSGYPAPELIPVHQFKESVVRLLEKEQDLPFHYLGSPGMENLKQSIQKRLSERGITVLEEELLITSGACQAIDLIARILVDDETVIAIEAPTYMEALEVFQNYTKRFISIPVDEQGMQTHVLEEVLAERESRGKPLPCLLYTIPTFQNPTGTTMKEDRRQHLLDLAEKYNFLILEDDAYGELNFRKCPPPLKAMDREGRVLYVGSLSKVVAPGLRIGWIAGLPDFITALAWFKKDLDHPFAQASMATFLESIDFEKWLNYIRSTYQLKSSILISAMKQHLPKSVTWYEPEGGYFVWVKITGINTSELLIHALSEGVSFVPGKYFFLDHNNGTAFLRLSFSYANKNEIVEGIQKLGKAVKLVLNNS
ncbi:aminotransferase-like domain-containing protein [Alkalihalobacterium elongatum]|uniref:aminotransferase-like domain-containing protein n=1 Tax=Alkalihalobacterium elongatum TaxID=2675466 RepID=UPI001C1FC30D|nr:PLP-dependent aminotransferase family protein [Alkalihalobacterium elongatum]